MTEPGLDGNLRYTGEGMEDMSLSSASSLERNDTSEEFLDDFDNLGDQLQIGIPQNKYPVATPTQTRLQGLLNETMDWTRIGLAGIDKCYTSNSCVCLTNSTVLITLSYCGRHAVFMLCYTMSLLRWKGRFDGWSAPWANAHVPWRGSSRDLLSGALPL